MNEVNILIATKKFLVEDRWTKGEYARKTDGEYCSPLDSDAVQWCAIGAVVHIAGSYKEANLAIFWLTNQMNKSITVTEWQDQKEIIHPDILNLFDKAIDQATTTHEDWNKELAG